MKLREFYVSTDLIHDTEIYRLHDGFWWYEEDGKVKQGGGGFACQAYLSARGRRAYHAPIRPTEEVAGESHYYVRMKGSTNGEQYYRLTQTTWTALFAPAAKSAGPIDKYARKFFTEDCERISRLYAYLRTGRQ